MGIENQLNIPSDRERKILEGRKSFEELLKDPAKLKKLINDSDFHDKGTPEEEYDQWKKSREAAVKAIDSDGTILDFGCANGFLLRCFQQWSNQNLDVYGFDVKEDRIDEARKLFKNQPSHFESENDAVKFLKEYTENFPQTFDYIYWNVWDNHIDKGDIANGKYFQPLFDRVKSGGKLILGLYHQDGEKNLKIIQELKAKNFNIERAIFDSSGNAFAVLKK